MGIRGYSRESRPAEGGWDTARQGRVRASETGCREAPRCSQAPGARAQLGSRLLGDRGCRGMCCHCCSTTREPAQANQRRGRALVTTTCLSASSSLHQATAEAESLQRGAPARAPRAGGLGHSRLPPLPSPPPSVTQASIPYSRGKKKKNHSLEASEYA